MPTPLAPPPPKRTPLQYLAAQLLVLPPLRLIYRIRILGRRNCPRKGAALLVANHVSFADPFIIAAAAPRIVRFLMYRGYYEIPILNWVFRAMGTIPISDRDSPKAVLRSFEAAKNLLREGKVVCIFAEGAITRHGQMLRFKKGFERIVKGLDVPIIPVHLDRLWGSLFSFAGGRALLKIPRRIPYPVTASFGPALPPTAPAHQVRQSILELGAEAFALRLGDKRPLGLEFLRQARRRWSRTALADLSGRRLSYGQALVGARGLGLSIAQLVAGDEAVAVLLPTSIEAALVTLGLTLGGKIPVPLSPSASREIVSACAAKAGASRIVTSRTFAERLGWSPDRAIFLEDLPRPSPWPAPALRWLPCALAEKLVAPAAGGLASVAAILFTSGSTALPKGVMLTHANILANIEAISQVYPTYDRDRFLAALPFSHAFGYTVTLWLPLLLGMGVALHPDPFDARSLAELCRAQGVTIAAVTPTMLLSWIRRVDPELLRGLRLVVTGGERLRPEVAEAFHRKFGILPLEGYGCTELSPVASVNIPDVEWERVQQTGSKPGTIGQPLPGVTIRAVDPETGGPVPEGSPGVLHVKGPNVMKGYVGDPERTAESLRDGYYVTGDVGIIDADGFVTITDRLSRFSKIAGEMVSHAAVEMRLQEAAGEIEPAFAVTSIPDEARGETLAAFYVGERDVEALRSALEASLPRLWIPESRRFHKIDKLPLLASGKLDLAGLKAAALELSKG